LRSAVLNHLIGIAFYALTFLECRLNLGVGRKFAGIRLRQTTFYLLDLPSLRRDERLERPVDDP
jgi:hypothetical protein